MLFDSRLLALKNCNQILTENYAIFEEFLFKIQK
jgi:hypothetical protein